MACFFPRTITNRRYLTTLKLQPGDPVPPDYKIVIPCGKCLECRKRYANGWKLRLLFEGRTSPSGVFFTFTFDDSHYPGDRITRSEFAAIFRRFKDRLRKRTGQKVRYFVITDVGKNTARLHFHGILLSRGFKTKKITYNDVRACWTEGYSWLGGYFDMRTFGYITKYINKTNHVDPDFVPMVLTSTRFGLDYARRNYNHDFFATHGLFNICGFSYAIPSYFRRVFLTPLEQLHLSWKNALRMLNSPPTTRWLGGRQYSPEEFDRLLKYGAQRLIECGKPYVPKFIWQRNPLSHALIFQYQFTLT